jgi:hypothetical protein
MNLSTARLWLKGEARNAGDSSSYDESDYDRALILAMQDFNRRCRFLQTTSDVAITAGAVTLGTLPVATGFRPALALRAWVPAKGRVKLIDYPALLYKAVNDTGTGYPRYVAFKSWSAGEVWPTPDANYVLKLLWLSPITLWTPGAPGDAITLDLPDEVLPGIIATGGVYHLQANQTDGIADKARREFEQYIIENMGRGGLGGSTGELIPGESPELDDSEDTRPEYP